MGDHQQLPSVEPGKFMDDLFNSLKIRGMTVTLMTNHRSEGNLIFDNATKIAKQQMPVFDESKGFVLIPPGRLKPSTSKIISTPRHRKHTLSKEMDDDKKMLYWSLLKDNKKEFGLENDEKSHIITFKNIECAEINCYGCWIYNKHMTIQEDLKTGKQSKSFQIGDKIICTKNADIPVIVPDGYEDSCSGDDPKKNVDILYTGLTSGDFKEDPNLKLKMETERLMNGNLYKIKAEVTRMVKCNNKNDEKVDEGNKDGAQRGGGEEKVTYWVLDDLDGNLIRVIPEILIKENKVDHAYAMTIHKFQGSEADTIVYGLSGSKMENWKHVYTAVTRGKKKVVIVSSYEDLRNAVQRKAPNRQTALGEKVKRLLKRVETMKKKKEASRMEEEGNSKTTGKRSALESPASLRTKCYTVSPTSYPPGTRSKQPQHLITVEEEEADVSFGGFDDSFGGLNCSLIEREAMAIISSQSRDVLKHLTEE